MTGNGARRSLPIGEWPAEDRAAWIAATAKGEGILDDAGPAAEWTEKSRTNLVYNYGRWLAWLNDQGHLSSPMPPASRVTKETVHAYIDHLRTYLAPFSVHTAVRLLYRAMHLFAPEQDWSWLKRIDAKVRRSATPVNMKTEALTSPRELLEAARGLMLSADDLVDRPQRERAVRYRDGLMIAILAARAPRRRSLSVMNVDEHLKLHGERYWLTFKAEDMKEGRASQHVLPEGFTPWIDRYLGFHRPSLVKPATPADGPLWLTENGQRLGAPAINFQVKKRTHETLGQAIPPHRFRDCLATAVAIDLPEHLHMAATILDHASLSTTQRHYNQAQAHSALRDWHDVLEKLENGT